jgi:hypothetical protein
MRIRIPLIASAVTILALVVVACGGSSSSGSSSANAPQPNAPENSPAGDIPDNQAFVRFSPPGADYSVKVPEGWARSTAGGAVTFTDKLNGIRMEESTAPVALTVREARQTEIPKLAQTVKGFQDGKATSVARPAGQAIRITYLASAPPNPVTGKAVTDAVERYAFFHKGHELVLTLSGPKGADNVDPWKIVTDSVRWSG